MSGLVPIVPTSWSTLAIVLSVFGLVILYYAFVSIYNVYFHPLSKFPGPKLVAATKIPIARVSWSGDISHWLASLHDRYNSDIVRISPDELSVIAPTAWKDVYGHRQGHPNFQKDLVLFAGVQGILTANDADHARMRRLLAHAFSDKALREQEPLIQSYVDTLLTQLDEQIKGPAGGKVNLADWYNWTTFDLTGDLSFGESFGCLKEELYHPWVAMMISGLKDVVFQSVAMRFPPLDSLLYLYAPKKVKQARANHIKMSIEKVERRMETVTDRPDFMSYILRHNDKEGMTKHEIHHNASTLILAGSETTATLLTGATYLLLKHPDCMVKVLEELRGSFRTKDEIDLQAVGRLEYFQAVVNESFRVYPPGVAGQGRRVPAEGDTVSGHWIPGGTGIQLNQYAAFHSSSNFLDPESFVPDRWLGNPRYANDNRSVLQPFSIGARNCIGKNLALSEIRLTLAHMLWHFDIELCEETDHRWLEQKSWFTWQKKPMVVGLRDRDSDKHST